MSTLNQLNAIDETLFTELTAEQSEIVEGGMFLKIYSIESVVSRADVAGADDAYIKFQGNKVWG
ncbi:MAG: hypothetical protein HC936_01110 [Leptolyngbyaceae cyanobacterium SU_3_3]|nr:hypothetical protein [Leptolyngbyaceae cyanobacterium SU_3_3]